jgi:adenylate cyclase
MLRMNFYKVLIITFAFTVVNVFIAFLIDAAINSVYSAGPSEVYDFSSYSWLSVVVGIASGILGGIALVSINTYMFRKRSFGFALATTAFYYLVVFLVVNIINSVITAKLSLDDPGLTEIMGVAEALLLNRFTLMILTMWGIISLFTLFLLQVSDKFGPGILWKFIQGRYYKPREEDRIFMFADMRSSTTFAEKIGHRQYFHLLSDLFADITDTILNHEAEIYQYVGDDIVVSWPLKRGIKNANCLECFFAIEKKLLSLAPAYMKNYGVAPELKAGLHHGSVMAGEIGVIKKDIIYSGDVLNTTARIQEQCNSYQVNVLISEDTMNLLKTPYRTKALGAFELRGKEQMVRLLTVQD